MIEIKAPSPGESVAEVQIAAWLVTDGATVAKDTVLCEIESDKATLTVVAEAAGRVAITVPVGEIVPVGTVIARIDPAAAASTTKPVVGTTMASPPATTAPATDAHAAPYAAGTASPAAAKAMAEQGLQAQQVTGTGKGGRITQADVVTVLAQAETPPAPSQAPAVTASTGAALAVGTRPRPLHREKMSMLRRALAQRLVAVKNQTAMLTTFNEVDMSEVIQLRKKFKDEFKDRYDVNLGYMSFFVKAVTAATRDFPAVNAMIDEGEVIYHDYLDMGIAVSAPKGLMVPVIRNAESLSFAEIELEIKRLAEKARQNQLTLEEMSGGTFTITNGGIFGSMLSTPILNPPQSAILGMHNIVERPVAVQGQVAIRPIMYVALSYDHRLIDGRESVGFLVAVKAHLEDPARLLVGV